MNQQDRQSLRIIAEFAARTPEYDDDTTHTRRLAALEQCAAAVPVLLRDLAAAELPPEDLSGVLDGIANLANALPSAWRRGTTLDLGFDDGRSFSDLAEIYGTEIETVVYSGNGERGGLPYVTETATYRTGLITVKARRLRPSTLAEESDVRERGESAGSNGVKVLSTTRKVPF